MLSSWGHDRQGRKECAVEDWGRLVCSVEGVAVEELVTALGSEVRPVRAGFPAVSLLSAHCSKRVGC
jgi:hypothetical protein